jgi:hypothetical protein
MNINNIVIFHQGSFSELEEPDLAALWIPKRAQVRILTLAGAIRRRLAVYSQRVDAKSYKNLEKQLLGSSAVKALTIDGDDKVYTTKADLKRAWERKQRDEAEPVEEEDGIKCKDHSAETRDKIEFIKR